MRACGGSNRRMASALTDFPEPDSPDQSQHLARADVKADIADSGHSPLSGGEFDAQVANIQQRSHKAMLAGV